MDQYGSEIFGIHAHIHAWNLEFMHLYMHEIIEFMF